MINKDQDHEIHAQIHFKQEDFRYYHESYNVNNSLL